MRRVLDSRQFAAIAPFLLGAVVAASLLFIFIFPVPAEVDGHSYLGGISYVFTRYDMFDLGAMPISPLDACEAYVADGYATLDGYASDEAFLEGCSDAMQFREWRSDLYGIEVAYK